MEPTIPDNSNTFSKYKDNMELFDACVQDLNGIEYDCLISRTDYYAPEGSEDFLGLYIQNMDDLSCHEYENSHVETLIEVCDVKLFDVVHVEELFICAFDMCVPGRNYDYGIYYVSEDQPIYLGDPAKSLVQNGNGYSYEQPADYGAKFTFYTEKITEHFYYYEIY